MGVEGAEWLDRAERDSEEDPDHAIDVLKIAKGSTVADIGAGSGYVTEKLAKKVGPMGRVYASDIQQGMIDLINKRIAKRKLANVTAVLSTQDDPRLPVEAIDLAIMVDVYHELSQPQLMLRHIKASLKPGGRLGAARATRSGTCACTVQGRGVTDRRGRSRCGGPGLGRMTRRRAVRELSVVGVRVELPSNQPIVLLKEVDGDRYLPIWIGAVEATAIAYEQQGVKPPRPLTHDLMRDILSALKAPLNAVEIVEMKENIFYADLLIGEGIRVSARPSDSIALALRVGAPIRCTDQVLAEAGIVIPDEQEDEVEKFREFLDQVSPEDFAG